MAVDITKGERCMLLKDHYGDWGICLGVWEGYKKGVPGKPGEYSETERLINLSRAF